MDLPARTSTTRRLSKSSPLSAFLSNLIEDHFGSIQVNREIVVDNPLSHAPFLPLVSAISDSDSIVRTTSSSSSSSSSRWDPNAFPYTGKNSSSSGRGQHGNDRSEADSSSDIPTLPTRRDSPGKWRWKPALLDAVGDKPRRRQLFASRCDTILEASFPEEEILPPPCPIRKVSMTPSDLFLSRSEPNLGHAWKDSKVRRPFGTKDSSRPSALFPPPYPIRQVSLSSCDMFLSRSEPDLAQAVLMHSSKNFSRQPKDASEGKGDDDQEMVKKKKKRRSTNKKKSKKPSRKFERKTKEIHSPPQAPRPLSLVSTLSEPTSPSRTPTKLYRYIRTTITPKKKKPNCPPEQLAVSTTATTTRTPLPAKLSIPLLPKIQKRDSTERETVRSTRIPDSFRFPIIEDKETPDNRHNSVATKSIAVNRCHRRPALARRSRHLVPISSPDSRLNDYATSSPRSTMELPEGRSLVSVLDSISSPIATVGSPRPSTRKRSTRNVQSHSNQIRPTFSASHRSLSETLLSCDRDTVEDVSTAMLSSSAQTNSQLNRDHKRAPPVQPIRQLSRALFDF